MMMLSELANCGGGGGASGGGMNRKKNQVSRGSKVGRVVVGLEFGGFQNDEEEN
jgi:hypothetical protein